MFHHVTVLKQEAVDGLNIKPDGIYVDCTVGGAGHSAEIASRLNDDGLLIGLDQDDAALRHAKERLAPFENRVRLVKSNFRRLSEVLKQFDLRAKGHDSARGVDGILFDLGVSSPQLDEGERGFSYNHDAPLDMRMDRSNALTAEIVVNEWEESELANILFRYGEEKFSRAIARRIVEERQKKAIRTTGELVEIIKSAIPARARRTGPHPAKRSFQAIRIAVNDELGAFEEALDDAIYSLNPGGRAAVITFHSLEDRLCKQIFAKWNQKCICPPDFPVCACGKVPLLRPVHRKPIVPKPEETAENPRARSAKLRIAEKLEEETAHV